MMWVQLFYKVLVAPRSFYQHFIWEQELWRVIFIELSLDSQYGSRFWSAELSHDDKKAQALKLIQEIWTQVEHRPWWRDNIVSVKTVSEGNIAAMALYSNAH